jgi:hypothetical protein
MSSESPRAVSLQGIQSFSSFFNVFEGLPKTLSFKNAAMGTSEVTETERKEDIDDV